MAIIDTENTVRREIQQIKGILYDLSKQKELSNTKDRLLSRGRVDTLQENDIVHRFRRG